MRAVTEALGLDPHDAEAQAVKAEIEAARPRRQTAPAPGSRAVGPPPPASARQLTERRARGAAGHRIAAGRHGAAAAAGPAAGAAAAAAGAGGAVHAAAGVRRGRARQTLVEAAARLPRHRRGGRDPLRLRRALHLAPGLGAVPRRTEVGAGSAGHAGDAGRHRAGARDAGRRRRARPRRRRPADASTTPATEPPVAPPTTPSSEDAAITSRLAQAVGEFQAQRTPTALNTLASLIDEAPQRDDLRQTAEQWARAHPGAHGRAARAGAQAGASCRR